MKHENKFKLLWIITLTAILSTQALAAEMSGVKDLTAIKADYDKLGSQADLKFDGERAALQREATGVIQKMAGEKKTLSGQQLQAFAQLLSIAVPADPTGAIVENNANVIKANLPALKTELSKLTASQREQILYSIDLALNPTTSEDPAHP